MHSILVLDIKKEDGEDIMYSILNKAYFRTHFLSKRYPSNKLFDYQSRLTSAVASKYFNIFTPFVYKHTLFKPYGLTKKKRNVKIIASLTSFPARIESVWITIETIMRQSVKPDEIILWLAKSQFNEIESVPKSLINQIERGLTIKFCDDLRSHKKYYYSMKENPNDIIVTFDDDMFYPYNTIEKLFNMHRKLPNDVICSCASFLEKGLIESDWIKPVEAVISSAFLSMVGCGGVLYPPHSLYKDTFNKEIMFKCTPNADDLWLTMMAFLNDTKLTCLRYQPYPITITDTQNHSLFVTNNSNAGLNNDVQWKSLLKEYRNELNL